MIDTILHYTKHGRENESLPFAEDSTLLAAAVAARDPCELQDSGDAGVRVLSKSPTYLS